MLTQRQRPAALLERELEACQLCSGVLLIIPDKKVLLRESVKESRSGREEEEEGKLAAACLLLGPSLALSPLAHEGLPLYKSSARWRKSTQRFPGEQTRPIALAAAPLAFLRSPRSPFHS